MLRTSITGRLGQLEYICDLFSIRVLLCFLPFFSFLFFFFIVFCQFFVVVTFLLKNSLSLINVDLRFVNVSCGLSEKLVFNSIGLILGLLI